jgi:hypothetical protein
LVALCFCQCCFCANNSLQAIVGGESPGPSGRRCALKF